MPEQADREIVETNIGHTVSALAGLAHLLASSDGGCGHGQLSDLIDIISRDAARSHAAAMRLLYPDRPQP